MLKRIIQKSDPVITEQIEDVQYQLGKIDATLSEYDQDYCKESDTHAHTLRDEYAMLSNELDGLIEKQFINPFDQ